MEKNEKHELAKKAMKAIAEIEETTRMEELIKDNKIEFTVEEVTYRVRKPNFGERQEIDSARRKKYLELIRDDSYLFRKQWIEVYRKKDIDIDAMENKVRSLDGEIKDTLLRLAKSTEPKDISSLKESVLRLRDEQFNISMEVTDLLSHSIEQQLLIYVNSFTTFLVLEKKEGETWKRVYKDYDTFMKADDKAIENAFYYLNVLIYSIGIEEKK